MRAVIYDPDAPAKLRLAEVADPIVADFQALVGVQALALNYGELHYIDQIRRPGEVPGWDSAGVVLQAAADGSGPPAGSLVVGSCPPGGSRVDGSDGTGGWAQRRAVSTENLAVLPNSVEVGAAAALPVAGMAALQALRALGSVVGRRILITGASGGVGRFAVQLAARAGAHVIGAVGAPARGAGLAALGAAEVVVGLDQLTEPVFGVLDNVGGTLLPQAFRLLSDGGSLQSIGAATDPPSTIDFDAERWTGIRKRLEPFTLRPPFGPDLDYLLALLAAGQLDPQIGLRAPWEDISTAASALLDRQVAGKAVLDVS
jgi:NADPH:quinone reductase